MTEGGGGRDDKLSKTIHIMTHVTVLTFSKTSPFHFMQTVRNNLSEANEQTAAGKCPQRRFSVAHSGLIQAEEF